MSRTAAATSVVIPGAPSAADPGKERPQDQRSSDACRQHERGTRVRRPDRLERRPARSDLQVADWIGGCSPAAAGTRAGASFAARRGGISSWPRGAAAAPPPPPDPAPVPRSPPVPPPTPTPQRTRATGTTMISPCSIGSPNTAWTLARAPTRSASRSSAPLRRPPSAASVASTRASASVIVIAVSICAIVGSRSGEGGRLLASQHLPQDGARDELRDQGAAEAEDRPARFERDTDACRDRP